MRYLPYWMLGFAALFLAGCYETDQPLLTSEGDRVPLTGTFQCGQGQGAVSVTEYAEDILQEHPTPSGVQVSYTYTSDQFEQLQLKGIGKDLYIAQIINPKGFTDVKILYLFFLFGRDGFAILTANWKHDNIQALAQQHHVKISPSKEVLVGSLAGTRSDILEFLAGHDLSMLDNIRQCRHSGT
jgi:hypothetical protein